jgi:hypothetical protein
MSKPEIADLFDVSVRTVHNWQTLRWLVRSGAKYDVEASIKGVENLLGGGDVVIRSCLRQNYLTY